MRSVDPGHSKPELGGHASDSSLDFREKSEALVPSRDETITVAEELPAIIVDWDGPDDPENPRNWKKFKKWAVVVLMSTYAFASPAASAMIAPASSQLREQFGLTSQVSSQIVTSIFVLAYAFGPLILSPLSELYGRNIMLQATNIWFLIFNIACGAAQNEGQLIAFRFLAGLGGGAPLSIGAGMIADCFALDERGIAISIFAIAPLLGPVLGPLTGAWVAEKASWRWVFWSTSIMTGIVQVLGLALIRESYAPVLLSRKAGRILKNMDKEKGPAPAVQTISDNPERHWKKHLGNALVRPFALFVREPIMQVLAVYMAFIYGLFYIFLTTMPTIYEGVYKENVGISGIHYLALGIGLVGGSQICALYQDKFYVDLQNKNDGVGKPEFRLVLMFPGSLMLPAGLFLSGWSSRASVHWIVPDIGLVLIGLGIILPWLSINTYLIDAFSLYAASSLATVMFLRSICGFGFPLFAPAMYSALGVGKADSILGALAIAIGCPAPWLFWHYGEKLRAASKYARK